MSERRVLLAEIVAIPGCEGRVADLLARLAHDVRAEPGNVSFEPSTVERNDSHFLIYEEYRDEDAFAAHLGAEHTVEFNRVVATLAEGGRSELTWLHPLINT